MNQNSQEHDDPKCTVGKPCCSNEECSPEADSAAHFATFKDANLKRLQGMSLKRKENFQEAYDSFFEALEILKSGKSNKEKALRVTCYLNLMSISLIMKNYSQVVKFGNEALIESPGNAKALYRRGLAYKEMRNLKNALIDLRNAAQKNRNDEYVLIALREVMLEIAKSQGLAPDDREVFLEGTLESLESRYTNPQRFSALKTFFQHHSSEEISSLTGSRVPPTAVSAIKSLVRDLSDDQIQEMASYGSSPPVLESSDDSAMAAKSTAESEDAVEEIGAREQCKVEGEWREMWKEREAGKGDSDSGQNGGETVGFVEHVWQSMNPRYRELLPGFVREWVRERQKDREVSKVMLEMLSEMSAEEISRFSAKTECPMSVEDVKQIHEMFSHWKPEALAKFVLFMKWTKAVAEMTAEVILFLPTLVQASFVLVVVAVLLRYFGLV